MTANFPMVRFSVWFSGFIPSHFACNNIPLVFSSTGGMGSTAFYKRLADMLAYKRTTVLSHNELAEMQVIVRSITIINHVHSRHPIITETTNT